MGRVWVVGSLNVDRPWRVARHPQVGETVTGEVLAPIPGGKGLNQAVAARRMGADVALVGVVGPDADGTWLRAVAVEEGIDVGALVTAADPQVTTGTALIVIADDGANTVTVAPGANALLEADGLAIAAGDVVVAQLEVPVEAVGRAFAAARAVGARTVLNPSPVGVGASLAAEADVVVVNEHELAALDGGAVPGSPAEAAARAAGLASDARSVVVTLGASGAVADGPAGGLVVAGSQVDAVDTTGAGDCFLGVLAAALAGGSPVPDAVRRANRAAALSVTRLGTVAAMPTAAEVDATS